MEAHPSASFSATLRVRLANRPGSFARLATAIGEAGGLLGAIDLVRVEVINVSDRTFLVHRGGKIETALTAPLKTRDDLSMAPGIAPVFGGINLEDISAPRCFEIEARLREELDIPVFHDDQHGTAVVVLAALLNALEVVGKALADVRVVVVGIGAAGTAVTKTLLAAGVREVVGCDRQGVVYRGRPGLTTAKAEYAELTNPRGLTGSADHALAGADVLVGVSGPGAVSADAVRSMADGAIVFAMANPTPEVPPEEIEDAVPVVGTGRSDYPNQINNVLVFPRIFRGALDARATAITEEVELAAAQAIAAMVKPHELEADYVIPSVFNRDVASAVAAAVAQAAERAGVARRPAPQAAPTLEPVGQRASTRAGGADALG